MLCLIIIYNYFRTKCRVYRFVCVPFRFDGARMQAKDNDRTNRDLSRDPNQRSTMYPSATRQRLFMPYRYRETVFIARSSAALYNSYQNRLCYLDQFDVVNCVFRYVNVLGNLSCMTKNQ